MVKALPQEWQARYVSMQRLVPDPIVPVVSGLCSSCFYQIIARDVTLLKKQEILECKNCYRLLYQEPEETAKS
jgi:predicted  nucleic acid-binding Zn-ribbon protein